MPVAYTLRALVLPLPPETKVLSHGAGEGSYLELGHCCSIITDILIPLDGRHIITCDRDEKIRTSRMPTDPSDGSHEIAAYCLGHRSFVTCLALVKSPGMTPQRCLAQILLFRVTHAFN